MESTKADTMFQKWLSFYWYEFSTFVKHNPFVVLAALGSLIGLRAEQKESLWKSVVVWFTGFTTAIVVCMLANHYFKLEPIAISALGYFMGTVGNKITFAFIIAVEKFIKSPKETINIIKEIILLSKFK